MKLEQTADGSYTLYVPELDEHYHSVKGALTESQHIFIDMGLKHSSVTAPHILEIGLGTGLNCVHTLLEAKESQRHVPCRRAAFSSLRNTLTLPSGQR